jgi:uncharacterized protein YegP (UPF0339 family)
MKADPGIRKGVRFEIYPDFAGRFRWRLRAHDQRIIADSGTSYFSLDAARMAAQQTKVAAPDAEIDGDLGKDG